MKIQSNKARQYGASRLTMLMLLVVLAFFIMTLARVVPVYVDHHYAKRIVEQVLLETTGDFDRAAFTDSYRRRAQVNNVQVAPSEFRFQTGTPTVIRLDYERRVPLLFNMDVVMSFSEEYTY